MNNFEDIYQDLRDFRETRKSVAELMQYRLAISQNQNWDANKIAEYRAKVLKAIDHLFEFDKK